jgi:hypothetical protein
MCCSLFGTFSLGLVNVSFVTSYAKLLAFGLGESATTKPVNLVAAKESEGGQRGRHGSELDQGKTHGITTACLPTPP